MILHEPVLKNEVISFLQKDASVIIDGTLGHGGHINAMIEHIENNNLIAIGLDVDKIMIKKAKTKIEEQKDDSSKQARIIHESYANINKVLKQEDLPGADFILLDIGVNLEHFKDTSRWFSIKGDANLDMRFNTEASQNAHQLINKYSEDQLSSVFEDYAEFSTSKSHEIAQTILKQRKHTPIATTQQLKIILKECWLGEKACAVIFQAIRIEVNQELENLKTCLNKLSQILKPWGRCLVLSYHSLEDRIVKQKFKALSQEWFTLLTKKVVKPHYTEVQKNKAARSAKLRCIQKD